ncbi:hypothetical protein A6A06_17475 [Streptomyces sp. CB02923]|uniref:hypothetical protein n=1 Tax=Streptomyces sp. CB02923 TaxID=1718985 RepID=UPI000939AAFD|nr:hypothetical protein [Streptomyces sp. CB02923]OKI00731.1 hypothetical protein A6A06_17475 [Streptomyces sp. CB02923]
MSQQADDPNEPLPRKSRADALAWAEQYTTAMAHYAGVKATDDPAPAEDFEKCVGRDDEVPDDGRFTLTYAVYAQVPQDRHIEAVRKVRRALEEHGVRVTSYEERPQRPEAVLYGFHDKERFSLIADSVKPPNLLRFSVSTPCFLPPGAEQQRF